MTGRIALDVGDIERARREIQDALDDHLRTAESLGRIRNDLPQMAPQDQARISSGLERAVADLVRVCFRYARAADALGVTLKIIREDEGREWDAGSLLSVLGVGYKLTTEVYAYAAKHGISVADAAEELGGGRALVGLVSALGPEGVASKVASKAALVKWGAAALVALEQWNEAEGGNWARLERTVSVTGISLGLGAVVNKACSRIPHLLGKGACYIVGGVVAGKGTDALAETLYGKDGFTKEERDTIRAAGTVSGLTPEEERHRAEEAREGWEAARDDLLEDLLAEGVPRDEAELIIDVNFPDYSLAGA